MNKNNIALIVGDNIKLQLNLNDYTTKWLAEEAGIEYTQLRKYMTGVLVMGVDKLVRICDALNCSPADLLRGTDKHVIEKHLNEMRDITE